MQRSTRTPQQQHLYTKYGTWAVVTGASDGIGREMALCLAQAGLNLVLVARRRTVLDQLAADLMARYSIETRVLDADLSQPAAVEAVIAATHDLEIGLLVASAGFGTSGRLIDAPLDQELAMLDVNCRAVLMMSQHFGKRFAAQGRGGMVLMSSLVAFQGVPGAANYAATKAYVQSLAEALHVELAPLGVDVIACAPGPVHSGFAAQADMQMSRAAQPADVAQATLNALGRKTTVRPGWLSKFLSGALSLSPRPRRVRAMGRIMAGMTKHKTA
ncbi:MAG: SDR family NAD(P)-dependent oxidoreductase [Armatimonadetes bacterium]|nr:SDR family NAD(P)-dependent oxidoreductase [Anaerolineae bacterium]